MPASMSGLRDGMRPFTPFLSCLRAYSCKNVDMQLKYIKSETCPVCKEQEIVRESRELVYEWGGNQGKPREIKRHGNGQEWEQREFLCGYVIEWVPNFSRETGLHGCRNHPVVQEAIGRINELKSQLRELEKEINYAEKAVDEEIGPKF